ncbi:aspartate/glutamate racemase family protein [Phycicoccus sp. CSK15P-2]|uniref:aspartate/glutamate racemase family protein n=1 Tax=Phycicoccus sp. CSK15P-2 TaxID=2807627 RepID=UPI0019529448|nr:aspartate/glutamate racemase family protein [Phycicoccus sp. CSK15P-2]MBM6402775.1 aspartate/glutamate racemase family protein [Phycicoccus sp. CSK15P-2]
MRLLGVLGGMSWTSTGLYYRGLNAGVADRLGGLHSARLLLHSVDFAPVAQAQHDGDWDLTAQVLGAAAGTLELGGAEAILLATNTMHRVAGEIEDAAGLPLLHIADPTAAALLADGRRRVGLLATRFTMEERFYVGRLHEQGLDVVVPGERDRATVHGIIYDELVRDVVRPESRDAYLAVVDRLVAAGVEAVVLGCTEITLLLQDGDADVPLYDTTALHVAAGVDWLCAD